MQELALGHTQARVPAAITLRTDELGALAADFNSMADQISELVTGREALLREMSHELRSPLARLQAAIALAAASDSLQDAERERIEKEIGRMNRVIGEMLHYGSLESSVPRKKQLIRVGRLLTDIVGDEDIEASDRGKQIKT